MINSIDFFRNKTQQKIGVIGGGQLAKMLAEAAESRGVNVLVQTASEDDPAVSRSGDLILANSNDVEGTRKLVEKRISSNISFSFSNKKGSSNRCC